MKLLNFFFVALLGICFFSSCSNSTKYAAEIKQLDSVLASVDSALIKFNSIDTTAMAEQLKEIKQDLKTCEENIKDTLTIEIAALLSEYRSSAKPFKTILERHAAYKNDLSKSKQQLEHLIHDLKIDKVDASKAASYIQDELIAASKAISASDISTNLSKLYSEKFELNKPKVKAFIDSLKK